MHCLIGLKWPSLIETESTGWYLHDKSILSSNSSFKIWGIVNENNVYISFKVENISDAKLL